MDAKKRAALYDFLERNCLVQKGSEFTHTSIYDPTGSYYVSPERTDKFFELYKEAALSGADLYLTEKHRDIGPVVVDLDFRFVHDEIRGVQRRYGEAELQSVCKLYATALAEFVTGIDSFEMYVMEKPSPILFKGLVKDGIHIVVPDIVTRPVFQLMMREKLLDSVKVALEHIGLSNPITDVVDEAVIERNNWQMLGSKKPHLASYAVTHIYKYDVATGELSEENVSTDRDAYIERLSIRNKFKETQIKFEKSEDLNKYQDLIQARKMRAHFKNTVLSKTKNYRTNKIESQEEYDRLSELVDLLSVARAENYNDWIRVGWCLRNIDNRLLTKWVEFSKKSPKFVAGECEKQWDYMRQDGACLGKGTLHLWAKHDDPTRFNDIVHADVQRLVLKAQNGTEYDVALVVQKMYDNRFIYDSRNKLWYVFHHHRWHQTDEGMALKRKLPTEIADLFRNTVGFLSTRAGNPTTPDEEKNNLDDTIKKLNTVTCKLKRASFQSSVMTEASMLFNIEKIDEKFDTHTNLVGFENGVYDLDAMEFREGRPEDYLTLTTGINYNELDANDALIQEIKGFLTQILPVERVREYVLGLFASFLHGNIREERFHVWTGIGSNGKSKILELFEKSFGEYCCTLPIALLTQKRGASNSASPELARARSKRFACLQEPGENERLNIGLMKEMTGGDKLYARGLYKEGGEFKPQFKMVLTCNHLPVVPSDDGGTWRRLRVVQFGSRFCEHPDPTKAHEYPIDTSLNLRFDDWKEPFMSLLIEYYRKIMTQKIKEPDEVLECTRDYQRRNDIIMEFLDNSVEKQENGFLSVTDAFVEFKSWLKSEGVQDRTMRKADFQNYIEKKFGKSVKKKLLKGWPGYNVKSSVTEYAGKDDYD